MRLVVVSPFLDRQHGTMMQVSEQLERFVARDHWRIELYSQRVEQVHNLRPGAACTDSSENGIFWHPVSDLPGPHLLKYIWWVFANQRQRRSDQRAARIKPDLVYSPGINCRDADVIAVHIVFRAFYERIKGDLSLARVPLRSWPRIVHRRLYYSLIASLERRIYADEKIRLIAVSSLVAAQLDKHFGRRDAVVIPNAVDTSRFHPEIRASRRTEARESFIGGGSVQLRSHLAQLPELDVEWNYLASAPVSGEQRRWLGQPLTPAQFASDLCARSGFLPGSTKKAKEIADKLEADRYWVVAHYEGISVAAELLSRGKHVHLTVHDEPVAMLIRSRRFRALWPLMSMTFAKVLKGAKSVDVTSAGMRDYFKQKYRVDSFALYKYVPALPSVWPQISSQHLRVGHIGSLYHPAPFRQFVLACREVAAKLNRPLTVVRIGSSPEMEGIISENLVPFETHGELLEQDAFPILASCDFVYAMYPPGFRFQGFRRTSLPIKLSTYIQAQRPIFAHAPPDSGLAILVSKHVLGQVCTTSRPDDLRSSIQRLLASRVPQESFEAARRELMGRDQLERLKKALQD